MAMLAAQFRLPVSAPLKPRRKVPVLLRAQGDDALDGFGGRPRAERAGVADGEGAVEDLGRAGVAVRRGVEAARGPVPTLVMPTASVWAIAPSTVSVPAVEPNATVPFGKRRGGEAGEGVEGDRPVPGVVAADVEQCARAEDARAGELQRYVHFDRRPAGGGVELHLCAVQDADARGRAERVGVLQTDDALVDAGRAREGTVGAGENQRAGRFLGQDRVPLTEPGWAIVELRCRSRRRWWRRC